MLTLGFLDASELRVLFASADEAEATLLKLATDVVAPLNELRAKAAAPGAIGALGGLAMAGAAGLAFAGILEVETAMATAGAVAALVAPWRRPWPPRCPPRRRRRGRAKKTFSLHWILILMLKDGSRRGRSATVLGQRALADSSAGRRDAHPAPRGAVATVLSRRQWDGFRGRRGNGVR